MFLDLVRRRPKKCLQPLKRPGGKPAKPRKNPAKTRKKTQKPANPEICCSRYFRTFSQFQKIFTMCVHGRTAEIFPETFMFGIK